MEMEMIKMSSLVSECTKHVLDLIKGHTMDFYEVKMKFF